MVTDSATLLRDIRDGTGFGSDVSTGGIELAWTLQAEGSLTMSTAKTCYTVKTVTKGRLKVFEYGGWAVSFVDRCI